MQSMQDQMHFLCADLGFPADWLPHADHQELLHLLQTPTSPLQHCQSTLGSATVISYYSTLNSLTIVYYFVHHGIAIKEVVI